MSRSGILVLVASALALAFLPATLASAGTTGKIAGTVADAKTGQPLVAATVQVEGTALGGITNADGKYFIINVQPGTYSLIAKLIGYQDQRTTGVQVFPDFTAPADFALAEAAIELEEVVVESEAPLIQPDQTGSAAFITAEDIDRLPVRGYQEAAAFSSGVVNFGQDLGTLDNSTEESRQGSSLVVRGGRPNQVGYFVDGFLQQDLLTGISSTSISNNAIDEVVFLKGGFDAEYGRLQSGIVNVVTREGRENYFGAIEGITDNLGGDWVGTDPQGYNLYGASFGGPILPNKFQHTFFASGERRFFRDREPSAITKEMADFARATLHPEGEPDSLFTPAEQTALGNPNDKSFTGLEDNILPTNDLSGWTWQGKVRFRITDKSDLRLSTLGSFDDWRQYLHHYLFDIDHTPRYQDSNYSGWAKYTHGLSASTFFNVNANYYYTERVRGDGYLFKDLIHYSRPTSNPDFDQFGNLFFNVDDPSTPVTFFPNGLVRSGDEDHVWDDYLRRISYYYGLSFDMTNQVDSNNQLKYGVDYRRHTLRRYNHFFPVNLHPGGPILSVDSLTASGSSDVDRYGFGILGVGENSDALDGEKHPIDFGIFLQDKYEYEGLVINGGLRYDYFNTDTQALVDPSRPLDQGTPGEIDEADLTKNEVYHRVSPRIGVGFPVTDKTLVRFNYGRFFQPPNLENLYVGYRFLEYKAELGGYFVSFGNPNLEPEVTTAYETAIAQTLGDNAKFEITTYYKSTKDLVQVRNIPSLSSSTKAYVSFLNTDFGTIKGVDVDFVLRPINRLSSNASYSFSFANGTGSLPGTQRDIAWTAGDPPRQTFPLDFDQRHKMVIDLDYRFGDNDGPLWSTVHPMENVGLNLAFLVASGTPYTPTLIFNEVTLAAVSSEPISSVNSRYGPWTYRIDLKGDKEFGIGGFDLDAYVWVINLLDRDNAIQVYSSSGSPTSSRFLTTDNGVNYADGFYNDPRSINADAADFFRLRELDPGFFGPPRSVRFGLKASF